MRDAGKWDRPGRLGIQGCRGVVARIHVLRLASRQAGVRGHLPWGKRTFARGWAAKLLDRRLARKPDVQRKHSAVRQTQAKGRPMITRRVNRIFQTPFHVCTCIYIIHAHIYICIYICLKHLCMYVCMYVCMIVD